MRTHSRLQSVLNLTLPVIALAFAAACSDDDDDDGGGGGSGVATVDVLITDAAADDLLSFTATIESLRLQREGGSFTSDLLTSREFDFLGLEDDFTLLARNTAIAVGNFTGAEIAFTPGSYAALAEDGSPVAVNSVSDTLLVPLPVTLNLTDDEYARFQLDLDLAGALTGDVSSGTIDFDPQGLCTTDDGTNDAPIDEVKGIVVTSNGVDSFVIDGFVGDEVQVDLGQVTVATGAGTLFLDDDGTELSSPQFFAALVPGSSLLEVHGDLAAGGVVNATRVEIEDQNGGAGSNDLVRIEGVVQTIGVDLFDLQVIEVEDGGVVADPILGALSGPDVISVSFDPTTVFLLEEDQVADSADLATGQKVKVKFSTFATEPFPASRVEIEDDNSEFEGVSTDVTGLPADFIVHLDADDPAIVAGLVTDVNTDVTVDLTGSTIVLDTVQQPALLPADILIELEVEPLGKLAGPPTGPTITAIETKVTPGKLDKAAVTTVDEIDRFFITTGGDIEDPFGKDVDPGPQKVLLEPTGVVVFEGDVDTEAEFFALFIALPPPTLVEVTVRGIGAGGITINEIRAFEIDVQVTP